MDQPTRYPWNDFPDVLIHASEQHVKRHPGDQQAKAGDVVASVGLVVESLSSGIIDRMNREFGSHAPLLLPVLAEESAGMNSIPQAMSEERVFRPTLLRAQARVDLRVWRIRRFSRGVWNLAYTMC